MGGGPARSTPSLGDRSKQRRRLVVIGGGGPAGLAALRVFLERPQLTGQDASWEIQAFEAKRDVGGVWLAAPPDTAGSSNQLQSDLQDRWKLPVSPRYESLTINVANPVMAFHDFLFPPETPLYPGGSTVQKYLSSFADHHGLRKFIQFNSPVQDLRWDTNSSKWIVRRDVVSSSPTGELKSTRQVEDAFDAAVIATGRYQMPYRPPIAGLAEWEAAGRKTIHSVIYREPSPFKGLVLLVVGAASSGLDISRDSVGVASKVLLSSTTGVYSNDESVKLRARLVELRGEDGTAVYDDGHSDQGIDLVVFATGYRLAYPFLQDLKYGAPPKNPSSDHLLATNYSIFPLARHTFPLTDYSPHTLAIMGLPKDLAVFRGLESQAQAVATVFLEPASWDQQREESIFEQRFSILERKFNGNYSEVAKHFHELVSDDPELDSWLTHRRGLLELAGPYAREWAIPPWEVELGGYQPGGILRKEWLTLVKEGVADEWVKGVGFGGIQDWVDLMWKVIRHAQERDAPVSFLDELHL